MKTFMMSLLLGAALLLPAAPVEAARAYRVRERVVVRPVYRPVYRNRVYGRGYYGGFYQRPIVNFGYGTPYAGYNGGFYGPYVY